MRWLAFAARGLDVILSRAKALSWNRRLLLDTLVIWRTKLNYRMRMRGKIS